jgi:hypothetical protein
MSTVTEERERYDISKPKYDLNTYSTFKYQGKTGLTCVPAGRLAHFYSTTSPLTLFASPAKLKQAQEDVRRYEGLIKENGSKGCWVSKEDKERWEHARQCRSTCLMTCR